MSGKPIVVKDGRFGPYVTDGETNASLRKGDTVEDITLERAAELLQIRRDAGPAKKARKGAKKAPAKKARQEGAGQEGAGKKAPAKKAAKRADAAVRVLIAGHRAPTRNVDPMAEQRQVPLPGLEPVGHDAPTDPSRRGGQPRRQARACTCGCSARRSSSASGWPRSSSASATGSASSPSPRWPPTSPRARRRPPSAS